MPQDLELWHTRVIWDFPKKDQGHWLRDIQILLDWSVDIVYIQTEINKKQSRACQKKSNQERQAYPCQTPIRTRIQYAL